MVFDRKTLPIFMGIKRYTYSKRADRFDPLVYLVTQNNAFKLASKVPKSFSWLEKKEQAYRLKTAGHPVEELEDYAMFMPKDLHSRLQSESLSQSYSIRWHFWKATRRLCRIN